ncbi:IucA/IucC family siderophore biosynthesis protein [Rhizobium sp. AAP43]|uniref:IucA/IucC family protein n=1 Tax=Rhizobium sp. AAP43 TaxID=1523420 RepID=UPI0006B92D5F|nr:IucA/IucC family protein [Rhizobium sp. AAP43]KPF42509.1 Rhizobactin siderophore biosynthesis protein RhbC [Rhizobium sp. AAP43]
MHKHDAAILALRSLINCIAREYADLTDWSFNETTTFSVRFPDRGGRITLPVLHHSATGHHVFGEPLLLEDLTGSRLITVVEALPIIITRLAPEDSQREGREEILERALSSRALIAEALDARADDLDGLRAEMLSFIEAEQGLLAGHGIHPCPKSRSGMTADQLARFSPEFGAGFPLHWFAIAPELYRTGHSEGIPAAQAWIGEALGPELADLKARLPSDDFALVPVHPWQAAHLLESGRIDPLLSYGGVIDLGEAGKEWFATSSVRTLYRPDMPFMLKLSLGIGITNSVRINLPKELLRGDDMARFRTHPAWSRFSENFPGLTFIPDPAWMAVADTNGELVDDLSVSVRENPFVGPGAERNVSALASLCEYLPGRGSRVGALIRNRAAAEHRSVDLVALDWFHAFLGVFTRPVVALYLTHGIALEAHQQNVLLEIRNGYPVGSFYRDNQGFFHHSRSHDALTAILPGLGEASQSVYDELPVDERVIYYSYINSMLGMVGAIGREGLISEERLLAALRDELLSLERKIGGQSRFVRKALHPILSCKANLRTRLARMDELVGPVETQSVYLDIVNPITLADVERAHA